MEWTNERDLAIPQLLFKISAAGKVFGRFRHWTPVVVSAKLIKRDKSREEQMTYFKDASRYQENKVMLHFERL